MASSERTEFEVEASDGTMLRGFKEGEGSPIVLAHGITAHRDLVVHGSSHLPRNGYQLISYDARGHGGSDPGHRGSYDYETLADDLETICRTQAGGGERPIVCGHSMGSHTILTAALRDPDHYRGLVLIGPANQGERAPDSTLAYWDGLADGLAEGGVEGWLQAYRAGGLNPEWEDTLLRIARDRMERHEHPDALANALREVPRSIPYDGLEPLGALELPALVVASRDEADPGHPFETARRICDHLPQARLVSEEEGESPLAWQGGKLSREIEDFAQGL